MVDWSAQNCHKICCNSKLIGGGIASLSWSRGGGEEDEIAHKESWMTILYIQCLHLDLMSEHYTNCWTSCPKSWETGLFEISLFFFFSTLSPLWLPSSDCYVIWSTSSVVWPSNPDPFLLLLAFIWAGLTFKGLHKSFYRGCLDFPLDLDMVWHSFLFLSHKY